MPRKETDPLAELEKIPRVVGPRQLKGKDKDNWDRFVTKYKNGAYVGLNLRQLHRWAVTNLHLECSLYTFKRALFDQAGLDGPIR